MIDTIIYFGALTLLHGTVLAFVTWLLSVTIFRRARPAVKAALWMIVLIKFLIPPILPGEMTLSGWITKTIFAVNQPVSVSDPDKPIAPSPDRPTRNAATIILRRAAIGSYISVTAFLTLWSFAAYRRTHRRAAALPVADDDIANEVQALAKSINLNCQIDVRVSDRKTAPHVIGMWPAIMVLPRDLLNLLEPVERQALILHELAHIHRNDQIVRWLENAIWVLLFFWPPVWWVCRRIERFTELACDQWAMDTSKIDPQSYARSLLDAVRNFNPAKVQSRSELAFAQNVKLLEERLIVALEHSAGKSPRISRTLIAALTMWALFALAGGALVKSQNQPLTQIADELVSEKSESVNPNRSEHSPQQPPVARATKRAKQNQLMTETKVVSQDPQSVNPSAPKSAVLTPYEEGLILGRIEAERRAREGNGASEPFKYRDLEEEMKSKREIERALQLRAAQSRRQQ